MRGKVPKRLTDMIGALPLFADCTRAERRAVLSLGTTLNVEPGTVLTVQEEPGDEFFVAVSGTAICTRAGAVIARFGRGDFFGEVALLDRGPRTASIIAESPMSVMAFSSREFTGLLAMPKVMRQMLPVVASRTRSAPEPSAVSRDASPGGRVSGSPRRPSEPVVPTLCFGPR